MSIQFWFGFWYSLMVLYSAEGAPHCSFRSVSIILIPCREKEENSKCHISQTRAFTLNTTLPLQGIQVTGQYSFSKHRLTVAPCIFLICSPISHTLSPCVLRTTQGSREFRISILNIRRQFREVNFLKVAQLLCGIARAGIIMAIVTINWILTKVLHSSLRFYVHYPG